MTLPALPSLIVVVLLLAALPDGQGQCKYYIRLIHARSNFSTHVQRPKWLLRVTRGLAVFIVVSRYTREYFTHTTAGNILGAAGYRSTRRKPATFGELHRPLETNVTLMKRTKSNLDSVLRPKSGKQRKQKNLEKSVNGNRIEPTSHGTLGVKGKHLISALGHAHLVFLV